jgi:integrase
MARGRKGLGVEPLATSIRFSFTLNGEPVRETLNWAPTTANVKRANILARDLRAAISNGSFRWEDYFPDSKRAPKATGAQTFSQFCALFLASITDKSANTRSQYRSALAWWTRQLGADTPMAELKHSRLKALWGATPWASWKLANNYLIPLRGVFALAVGDGLLPKSPLEGITNKERPPEANEPPDPFTDEEERLILGRMTEFCPAQVVNYFDFAFATGMRPEELIELRWSDVDLRKGVARLTRAKSLGEVRNPKNKRFRDVDLNTRARAALARQRLFTALAGDDPTIFSNPVTGSPWNDTAAQRDTYWKPVVRALGIRYRVPYNTRHTRASRMLMAGCKPGWCAAQLGHSLEMFYRVYAKWIEGADQGSELAKDEASATAILPAFIHGNDLRDVKPKEINDLIGRRDWTRTKLRRVKAG